MDTSRSGLWFCTALLAIILFVSWLIVAPFLGALVMAATLAFLFKPWYQKLLRIVRSQSIAAIIIVALVIGIIFLPLSFFGLNVFNQATGVYTSLTSRGSFDFSGTLSNFLQAHFPTLPAPEIISSINQYIQQALTWVIQHLGSLFSSIAQIFFLAFLSLIGLFYFLIDGGRIKEWLYETIPLSQKDTQEIITDIEATAGSVIRGTLLMAIIDGIVMGIGFFLFHIPNPTFWGALVIPVSIIPVVGVWIVAVPAIGYLFLSGQTILGVGLLVWSVILVNLIYSLLSPQLMRQRGADAHNLHPYVILLSVLGGIGFFGPIGFLIGPLVIALLSALLKIYKKLTTNF